MPIDLSEALADHQRGEIDRAARSYEAAIQAEPAHDQAFYLLGMVYLQRGDAAGSMALISRAIALRPAISNYHAGMAEACWAAGQRERSAAHGLEAVRLDPGNGQVRSNLGSTLLSLGRVSEAEAHFREAIRIRPDFAEAYNNLGHARQLLGDSRGAVACFREAIRLQPNLAEALGNLGKILLERGDATEALETCLQAVGLQPDSADLQLKLGNVYQILGRLDEAGACFRRAVELQPGLAAAHASLGGLLEHQGELDRSLGSLEEALRLDPYHAGVLAKLATRLRDRLPERHQAAIERLLARPNLVSDQRLPLLFGMAQVHDARREYERAARLSTEGNARQQAEFAERGLAYDALARARDIEELIATFTPDFFEKVQGWGIVTDRPIFIVGMPRSGTSLVEQILASHSRVFGAGELTLASDSFIGYLQQARKGTVRATFEQLDRPAVEDLAHAFLRGLESLDRSSDRIVDKMPENSLFLGFIAALFPRARIIHCRRDPRDTALSCWMTHFGQLRWSCHAGHIAARIVETDRIMDHWRRVLPLPIVEVVYEDLVANLESSARTLIEWAGLDWEPSCLEFHKTRREVRTASVTQVRQPIYRGSLGRWKNYERWLPFLFEPLN